MKELVNTCCNCGKDLYCIDGFFYGVHTEEQQAFCFECAEQKEKSAD